MNNLLIAGTRRHAEIMIRWLKLSPDLWTPMAYGEAVDGLYRGAKLVRPSEGVTADHIAWVFGVLRPRVLGQIGTVSWGLISNHPRDEEPAQLENEYVWA